MINFLSVVQTPAPAPQALDLKATEILGVIGFVMSVVSAAIAWRNQRKRMRLSVLDYIYGDSFVSVFILVENLSRLPIAITSILIEDRGGKMNCCEIEPVKVKVFTSRTGKEITSQEIFKTIALPVQLQPLGAQNGYLEFRRISSKPLTPGTGVSFQINTNRGQINKTITLGEMGGFLRPDNM